MQLDERKMKNLQAIIRNYLETGELLPGPTRKEIHEMILRHCQMDIDYCGEHTAMREMRKHVAWYTTGLPHCARLRGRINEMNTFEELEALLEEYLEAE